jgi:RecA/RadA recombinase
MAVGFNSLTETDCGPIYENLGDSKLQKNKESKKMSLVDILKKTSTIKASDILDVSKFFTKADMVTTSVPAINVALSGKLDGGFVPGLTLFAGPSKHFKTSFSLLLVKAYMDKYPDSALLFYDSEFGTPQDYFKSFGIDTSRVLHTPITNIEELKFDVMKQLEAIERGARVIIVIDSIGNLASKKEFDDAMDGKSVADMTRAKALKGLFRMVTPHLAMKDIPMVAINHTYMCGTKDMMVTTEAGSVSLKDVEIGCNVLTTNGFEPVSNKFMYEDAYITDIEMEDGTILSFTSGHRFKVNGEWVFVEDLKVGMRLDII